MGEAFRSQTNNYCFDRYRSVLNSKSKLVTHSRWYYFRDNSEHYFASPVLQQSLQVERRREGDTTTQQDIVLDYADNRGYNRMHRPWYSHLLDYQRRLLCRGRDLIDSHI